MSLDPLKPSRADYRLIHKLLDSSYSGKVLHTEECYELIIKVFQQAGGLGRSCSWAPQTMYPSSRRSFG